MQEKARIGCIGPIPTCSHLFQSIPAYFSLFQSIPTIPFHSNLFPDPQSPIPNLKFDMPNCALYLQLGMLSVSSLLDLEFSKIIQFSQSFSSHRLINHLVTMLFVRQPRVHQVCHNFSLLQIPT